MYRRFFELFIVFVVVSVFVFEFCIKDNNYYSNSVTDLTDIKANYSNVVEVINTSSLYKIEGNDYEKVNDVNKGMIFTLDGIYGEYYKIKDLPFYIYYKNVSGSSIKNNRYKEYLKLGVKITTNDEYYIYQSEDLKLKVDGSSIYDVIYKDGNKYYVEINDILYYIYDKDIKEENKYDIDNVNVLDKVAVLNYHFFYDKTKETCDQSICLERNKFEEHLKYFKDNNILTLTMNEYYLWLEGNLALPKKSVLITVDDGALGTDTILIELLEKYDLYGTLFLITEWWPEKDFKSDNLEVYSHGNDIHIANFCSAGPKGVCLSYNALKEDITKSLSRSKSNLAFCYPFYVYNNTMLNVLNDLGFKLAFVGGNRKSTKNDNRLLIPRYVVYSNFTKDNIAQIVN